MLISVCLLIKGRAGPALRPRCLIDVDGNSTLSMLFNKLVRGDIQGFQAIENDSKEFEAVERGQIEASVRPQADAEEAGDPGQLSAGGG